MKQQNVMSYKNVVKSNRGHYVSGCVLTSQTRRLYNEPWTGTNSELWIKIAALAERLVGLAFESRLRRALQTSHYRLHDQAVAYYVMKLQDL